MSKQDYYQTLGINKNASKEDIKSAYKKLAREHHPDMVNDTDKKAAEERFKEINEAYQILSDVQKKQMYDQFGHNGPNMGGNSGSNQGPFSYTYSSGGFGDVNPFDIFEDIFGFRGFSGARKPQKGKNLYYQMSVDFKTAIFGSDQTVDVESGKVKIKIPKGIRDGTEVKFASKGMPGPNGLPPGDLLISFTVVTPKPFQRAGDNLGIVQDIDFVQAVLGDVIQVPVIDLDKENGVGKARLKIPAGTQPNTQFVIRGKGMPRLNRSGQGDVIVRTTISIPKRLSKKQRDILEKYRDL